jgi:hypothetical protein
MKVAVVSMLLLKNGRNCLQTLLAAEPADHLLVARYSALIFKSTALLPVVK